MYIPGYQAHQQQQQQAHSMGHSPFGLGQTSSHPNPAGAGRARSVTPTSQEGGLAPTHQVRNSQLHRITSIILYATLFSSISHQTSALGSRRGPDNRMLYQELQFPVTSNYGSMKKRSQRSSAANSTSNNTNSTTVLSSAGEPSPPSSTDDSHNSTLPVSHSLDNVHRYLPEYLAISNRKTAV